MEHSDSDKLQQFIFDDHPIRGVMIRMDKSYHAILNRHPYPLPIRKLLGETLAVTALLNATMKYEGSLTLQTDSLGPLKLLVAQSDNHFNIRGLAQWQGEVKANTFSNLLGHGQLAMTVTPKLGNRYQSIVTLNGANLAASVEAYFQQSEQTITSLCLFADEGQAFGLLLQILPDDQQALQAQFWEQVTQAIKSISLNEIAQLSNTAILNRLFFNESIQLFESKPVNFYCSCTVERMEQAIGLNDAQEIQTLLHSNQSISVTCEFCNHRYDFDKRDIARIFFEDLLREAPTTAH
jgi:molecular chaperone Hsp33